MAWVPEGGKSRRYRNTRTGATISRRQYDNQRARRAGFTSRSELERVRERLRAEAYGGESFWLADIRAHTRRNPTFQDYFDVAAVKARRAQRRAEGYDRFSEDQDPFLSDPDGPLARILDRSGRRPLTGRPVGGS